MKYNQVVEEINKLIANTISFSEAGSQLQEALSSCSTEDFLDHLDYGGVIPERFEHDSTEEKVFAKYCDALLARALSELGYDTNVIEARSNRADVEAECKAYCLVGDAKAFRLSRTARNQKDFKVEALNQWRSEADYACLLAPLYQYPNTNSQIYSQAIRYNVTLLSYTHLAFMIRSNKVDADNLVELWQLGKTLTENQSALAYWAAIRDVMLTITGKNDAAWEGAIQDAYAHLQEQAIEEIRYWEERRKHIEKLGKKAAVKMLIKTLKIDSKITVIRRTGNL
jgi:type II restriction enzyme